jgi:hypothetical protein
MRTQLPLSLSYSYSYHLASLTRRGTPTQENGNDGCLRWWKVVVLVVDGSHRSVGFCGPWSLYFCRYVAFIWLWLCFLDAPYFVIAF